jgi:hypothetical protein
VLSNLLSSPAEYIASCADLISSVWYGNIALQQCMLRINRLRDSCWFDDKNTSVEYSHVKKWWYGMRHKLKKKERNT